jgi:hypothetical protein
MPNVMGVFLHGSLAPKGIWVASGYCMCGHCCAEFGFKQVVSCHVCGVLHSAPGVALRTAELYGT